METAEAEPNVRLIAGWTGIALFYLGGILVVLVAAWFFGRLARGDVRVAKRVAEVQGLIVLAGAVSVFGMGLAVVSLDSAPLVPLGLGFIGLSLAIGISGPSSFGGDPDASCEHEVRISLRDDQMQERATSCEGPCAIPGRAPNRGRSNTCMEVANTCTRLQSTVDFSVEIVPNVARTYAGVFWTAASGFRFAPAMRESFENSSRPSSIGRAVVL